MIDIKDARRRHRAELERALACAGGKTRKRTYRAMIRAVTEYRGARLDAPDADVLVWSDLHLGHSNIIDDQDRRSSTSQIRTRRSGTHGNAWCSPSRCSCSSATSPWARRSAKRRGSG